jgi:predicted kinase
MLFGDPVADGKRWVLEGRLISVALQALRLGTSVVLDYGLWARDERSALRRLARSAGAACQVVYLPVDKGVQLARIAHRQETTPHLTRSQVTRQVSQSPQARLLERLGWAYEPSRNGEASWCGRGLASSERPA